MEQDHRRSAHHIWWLGCAYFAFYLPYSGLTKSLSSGLLPGLEGPISGFELLPATALGSLLGMPIFLLLTGWWRYAGRRRVLGVEVPVAGRWPALSGLATALIIGATTLNYTFAGVSILFVLLLMRGGVLVLSPIVDLMRRRRVAWYSWTALTISLTAVAVALADVDGYHMTPFAAVNLGVYLAAYLARFQIMSGRAKLRDEAVNRRYFVEEHMVAMPLLVAILLLQAILGGGEIMLSLRRGFTTFLFTEAAIPAFLIGLFYEALFIFGTLIYLDHREYSFCVPVNRGASLVAGLAATVLLALFFGTPLPGGSALAGVGLIGLALLVLAYGPRWKRSALGEVPGLKVSQRLILFVCGGNTGRSPMAAVLCSEALAGRLGIPLGALSAAGVSVASAGVSARPGSPMAPEARDALRELGVDPGHHRTRPISSELIASAEKIFCMEEGQRRAVLRMAPEAIERTHLLDPEGELPDPAGGGIAAYRASAARLRSLIALRVSDFAAA